jgi:hypothetical protein
MLQQKNSKRPARQPFDQMAPVIRYSRNVANLASSPGQMAVAPRRPKRYADH